MKIWGREDPRLLKRARLLGEHLEIHQGRNGLARRSAGDPSGWCNHPEVRRFVRCPEMLDFRHELVRVEMDRRWPGRHDRYAHRTPVPDLPYELEELLQIYAAGTIEPVEFAEWVTERGFPPTLIGYDTPAERFELKGH